jgi:hypothetical protein
LTLSCRTRARTAPLSTCSTIHSAIFRIHAVAKKFNVTKVLRDRVAVLRSGGMERDEIADAIGCSERTLRTYFLPELNEGKAGKRAEAIARLFELGIEGNVSALKAFLVKADAILRLPREAKLGKKEQAVKDAATAHRGSHWGEVLENSVH